MLTHKGFLQNTEQETQGLRSRLEATEQRQQQMTTFLTKAVQNPVFLQQLLNQRQAQRISGPDKSEALLLLPQHGMARHVMQLMLVAWPKKSGLHQMLCELQRQC